MRDWQHFLTIPKKIWTDRTYSQDKRDEEQTKSQGTAKEASQQNNYKNSIIALALALFFFVIIKNAWLSDDGYITLRTVSNFLHGYGLTWNSDERVQVYTHPLWMLLLSGVSFCVHSIYFSSLLLSLGVSAIVITLFAFRLTPSPFIAVVGVAILAASKSFVDFSTSGLENPFTHLLIVLFALVFFQYQQSKRYLLWLSLLGSMMILNRMDTVLLFLPALLSAWYRTSQPKLKALRTMLLAFIPFLGWELFSLFYYGFLFPNTAYAKLNTGISNAQLLKQGLAYLISSSLFDPLLFMVIVSAILLVVTVRDWKSIPLLLGMVLYVAYVVKVGGDFMAGRFLTPPFLIAVILLVRNIPSSASISWGLIFVAVVLLGFLVTNSRWYSINSSSQYMDSRGVGDEHAFYKNATGLINFQRNLPMPNSAWYQWGAQARLKHDKVFVAAGIGFIGYGAGPQVHVLDVLALADPLLARLPLSPNEMGNWRIGHFERALPAGYLQTLETGTNLIHDPDLAQYYAKLHDVISGPLFSGQRLVEIWNFNIGAYNGLLRHYIQSLSSHSHTPANPPPSTLGNAWVEERALRLR